MLSGFIFPIASMPRSLQNVTYVVPARYFLIALRGVVLKGVGLRRHLAADRGAGDLRGRPSWGSHRSGCGGEWT